MNLFVFLKKKHISKSRLCNYVFFFFFLFFFCFFFLLFFFFFFCFFLFACLLFFFFFLNVHWQVNGQNPLVQKGLLTRKLVFFFLFLEENL